MDHLTASSLVVPDAAGPAARDDARERAGPRGLTIVSPKPGRLRRGLSLVRRTFFWIFFAVLITGVAGALLYLRTWPPVAVVQSGSMVPTIQIGDVVVFKHLDGPPRVGDIILVHVPDAARARYGYPPVITHRVYAIHHGMITTKGDALKTVDPFTTPVSTVTEKVVAIVPDAGRIFGFFTSTWGMLWLAAGVLMLIGVPLLDRHTEREEYERETLDTLHTQLETLTKELAERRDEPVPAPPALPIESLEAVLRALLDQAASNQRTLADATVALQEHQSWIRESTGAPDEELAGAATAVAVQDRPASDEAEAAEEPQTLEVSAVDALDAAKPFVAPVEPDAIEFPEEAVARLEFTGPPPAPPRLEFAPRTSAPPKLILVRHECPPPKLVIMSREIAPPKLVISHNSAPPKLVLVSRDTPPPKLMIVRSETAAPTVRFVRSEPDPPKLEIVPAAAEELPALEIEGARESPVPPGAPTPDLDGAPNRGRLSSSLAVAAVAVAAGALGAAAAGRRGRGIPRRV
jgi:signal peptidase I